jgi:hypothetical protein
MLSKLKSLNNYGVWSYYLSHRISRKHITRADYNGRLVLLSLNRLFERIKL